MCNMHNFSVVNSLSILQLPHSPATTTLTEVNLSSSRIYTYKMPNIKFGPKSVTEKKKKYYGGLRMDICIYEYQMSERETTKTI